MSGVSGDYQQNILRLLRDAFAEFGSWRVTHVEPTGMSHVESVTAGQLATIAFDALAAEGLLLSPEGAVSGSRGGSDGE